MRERDAGWVTHRSDKDPTQLVEHPAVVLRVSIGRAMILHGTGTERSETCVSVDPSSRDGKALGLTKRTFFYKSGILIVSDDKRFRATVPCPPDLFLALRKLVGF